MPDMSALVVPSGFGGVFGCSSIMLIALISKFTFIVKETNKGKPSKVIIRKKDTDPPPSPVLLVLVLMVQILSTDLDGGAK